MSTEATQVMQNGQDNPASDVANLIAHLTNSAGVNGNGPIEQMLARMPPHESASVLQQVRYSHPLSPVCPRLFPCNEIGDVLLSAVEVDECIYLECHVTARPDAPRGHDVCTGTVSARASPPPASPLHLPKPIFPIVY